MRLGEAPTAALGSEDLTVLTAWAEGVAEAAVHAPDRIDGLLAAARAGASWRAAFGLPEPSPELGDAMESLGRVIHAAEVPTEAPAFDEMLAAVSGDRPGEGRLDGLARRALLATLEERGTRRSTQASEVR